MGHGVGHGMGVTYTTTPLGLSSATLGGDEWQ